MKERNHCKGKISQEIRKYFKWALAISYPPLGIKIPATATAQIQNHTAALPSLQRILTLGKECQIFPFSGFPQFVTAPASLRARLGWRAEPGRACGDGAQAGVPPARSPLPAGVAPPAGLCRARRWSCSSRSSGAAFPGSVRQLRRAAPGRGRQCGLGAARRSGAITMALCPAVAASSSAARPYLLRKCLL